MIKKPPVFDPKTGDMTLDMLYLDDDAFEVWRDFHVEVERSMGPGMEFSDIKDVASKAAENVARVAALFHALERDGNAITDESVRRATEVVSWHLSEFKRVFGAASAPIHISNAIKVLGFLVHYCRLNKVEEISTRDLMRLGPPSTRSKEKLMPAIEEMAECNIIKVVDKGKRKILRVNPKVLT